MKTKGNLMKDERLSGADEIQFRFISLSHHSENVDYLKLDSSNIFVVGGNAKLTDRLKVYPFKGCWLFHNN